VCVCVRVGMKKCKGIAYHKSNNTNRHITRMGLLQKEAGNSNKCSLSILLSFGSRAKYKLATEKARTHENNSYI